MAVDASDHVCIAASDGGSGGYTNNNRIRMFILPAAATTAPSASSISVGTGRPTASPPLSVPSDALAKSASSGEPLSLRDKEVDDTNALSGAIQCF